MPTPISRRLEATKRADLRCEERGCMRPVARFGPFCEMHAARHKRVGHAGGVSVKMKTVRAYRGLVEDVIERNADHPGITAALDWWKGLQSEAAFRHAQGDPGQLWLILSAQSRQGVEPKELLTVAATYYLLLELKLFQPASTRHEAWQMTRVLFMTWPPSGQRPVRDSKAASKRRLHELVTGSQGGLLAAIAKKAAADYHRADEAPMRRPEPLT